MGDRIRNLLTASGEEIIAEPPIKRRPDFTTTPNDHGQIYTSIPVEFLLHYDEPPPLISPIISWSHWSNAIAVIPENRDDIVNIIHKAEVQVISQSYLFTQTVNIVDMSTAFDQLLNIE